MIAYVPPPAPAADSRSPRPSRARGFGLVEFLTTVFYAGAAVLIFGDGTNEIRVWVSLGLFIAALSLVMAYLVAFMVDHVVGLYSRDDR